MSVIFVMQPVAAQKAEAPARPEVFRKLIGCRDIADNGERLRCYDEQAANLDTAERNAEVMVVDRQQVKTAKRGLFGLSVPSIGKLFGKGDDKDEVSAELDSLESTIKRVGSTASGKLMVTIEDGARWVQTDSRTIRTPKVGQSIRIRKAAMGSFFANINDAAAIRMRREN